MIARQPVQVRWAQRTHQRTGMARKEDDQLQREIDNLLRDLKRSGENLAVTRLKLEMLFKLSQTPNRGTKTKNARHRGTSAN